MSKELRIIFAGTPDFAACHLEEILSSGYHVTGVFTLPDRPAGRGRNLTSSPVKILAKVKGLPVFESISLNSLESLHLISDLKADVMIVVAYGLILPKSILDIPRLGCINVHGSLLPRWRGAAPIQRALQAGDNTTGVTIIQMDTNLDAGNILYKLSCPITSEDTSATLYFKLANLGRKGLIVVLQLLSAGNINPRVLDENVVTYAKKLSKEEARINWSLPASYLERCIRAFNPWPVSWLMIDGQPIKIWKASAIHALIDADPGLLLAVNKSGIQIATADGILNLELLLPAGKKVMSFSDLLNSHRKWFTPGLYLS